MGDTEKRTERQKNVDSFRPPHPGFENLSPTITNRRSVEFVRTALIMNRVYSLIFQDGKKVEMPFEILPPLTSAAATVEV